MRELDKAIDALRELATKIGQTIDLLWPQYLQYLVWRAIGEIIGSCLASLISLYVLMRLIKADIGEDARHAGLVVAWILFTITTVIFIIVTSDSIAIIVSPAGYAVHSIISPSK